jgi:trans-2,3-dihydro-3-hydroxyanthranilate isomerase
MVARLSCCYRARVRTYRYLHLDVFTERPFEGNQLAVFPQPQGLSTKDMQRITKEMNFSECTFIFPAETPGTGVRMRIFTPAEELPMAGHPTIGSTYALVHERVIAPRRTEFVFGLGVGPTPVSLEWRESTLDFVWMTQQPPSFRGRIKDRAGFVRAIGLSPEEVARDLPIEVISCGVPFLIAPIASRDAVDRVIIERRAYREVCLASGLDELPLFAFTTDRTNATEDEAVYSRMLAPQLGVSEDPATGSASGPLGCYLATYDLVPKSALAHHISLQGVRMGRPSRIHVSIDQSGGRIARVRVGGRSVLLGDGRLFW